jgi:hypothetical protein
MVAAASNLPRARVEERVTALIERDRYGMRAQLAAAFLEPYKERR